MSGGCGPSRGGERAAEDLGFYLGGKGLPGGPALKNPPANAGVTGLIPGSGKYPGEGNGNPLQYSRLENSMDGGAWWTTVHGSQRLNDFALLVVGTVRFVF